MQAEPIKNIIHKNVGQASMNQRSLAHNYF